MSELEKCTTYRRDGSNCTITCNLGLWEVSGNYGLQLINEAEHYFQQYKSDGEYYQIIGGKSPVELMMNEGK
jgi:hypothetical protein